MPDNTINFGHNESPVRLAILDEAARAALGRVANGETTAIDGWLDYGAALNEARALLKGDREFGQWVEAMCFDKLSMRPNEHEQVSAMWAAREPEQFETARAAGNARTVRGIYAKWQEIDAERKAAEDRARAAVERIKADAERKIAADAKAQADAKKAEAKAKADEEAAATRAAKRAKDEATRAIAKEQARVAAAAKAEAEARSKSEDDKARVAIRQAGAADRAAKAAEKSAKSNDKKAEKAKAGNPATSTAHVANNSGENEWYTPAIYIKAARLVLGGIDLDPASSDIANATVGAERIFTAENDGLAQEWPIGRIWCNPPYSKGLIEPFATRLAQAARDGSQVIVLVNNATETAWFQIIAAACSAICFPKSRIKFLDQQGNANGAPLQGQAIIYCGPDVSSFAEAFAPFGLVLRHE